MSSGALMLGISDGLSGNKPTSPTIPRKVRLILTSTAATLPILHMSTSMVGCALTYSYVQGISTSQSAKLRFTLNKGTKSKNTNGCAFVLFNSSPYMFGSGISMFRCTERS